jgi:hypothetical protein
MVTCRGCTLASTSVTGVPVTWTSRLSCSSSVGSGAIFATLAPPGTVVSTANRSPVRTPVPAQVAEWSAISRMVQVPDGCPPRLSWITWPRATPSCAPASRYPAVAVAKVTFPSTRRATVGAGAPCCGAP